MTKKPVKTPKLLKSVVSKRIINKYESSFISKLKFTKEIITGLKAIKVMLKNLALDKENFSYKKRSKILKTITRDLIQYVKNYTIITNFGLSKTKLNIIKKKNKEIFKTNFKSVTIRDLDSLENKLYKEAALNNEISAESVFFLNHLDGLDAMEYQISDELNIFQILESLYLEFYNYLKKTYGIR